MTVVINGDTGVSGVDGTAGTPALQGNDTNTGIFFPAADTIAFAEGGVEVARFDSSGNLGIGTGSPNGKLAVIGSSSATLGSLVQFTITGGQGFYLNSNSTGLLNTLAVGTGENLAFNTGSTERARIDSNGNLLVGVTSTFSQVGVTTTNTFTTATNISWAGAFQNTAGTTPCGLLVRYGTDPNGTGSSFLYCLGNATLRADLRSNGGLANFSANNVNLSDARLKTDVQTAGSYLEKICAIPVVTYLYKDQTDTERNLGVLAQDVETVAPELVDVSGFGETPEDGVPLKAIYQTDLQYALMKCIQEQQQMIEELKAKVAALEAR
jgi:hypothetical protein